MHKVFISYHHQNDQWHKEELLRINKTHEVFIDASVDTGDIENSLDDSSVMSSLI